MAFRIARQQAELARKVLDIVHHEGDAPIELVEPVRLQQRDLAVVLRQIACQLLPDDAQQVEILPIELARHRRPAEHDHAHQPFEMQQRHQRPGFAILHQPARHPCPFALMIRAGAHLVEVDDEAVLFEEGDARRLHRHARDFGSGPLPAPGEFKVTGFGRHQQQALGTVGDIGQRLHHARMQRQRLRSTVSDRAREAQPFSPIIVAVLEQVLGEHDLGPAPQALGWHHGQHQHRDGHRKP